MTSCCYRPVYETKSMQYLDAHIFCIIMVNLPRNNLFFSSSLFSLLFICAQFCNVYNWKKKHMCSQMRSQMLACSQMCVHKICVHKCVFCTFSHHFSFATKCSGGRNKMLQVKNCCHIKSGLITSIKLNKIRFLTFMEFGGRQ